MFEDELWIEYRIEADSIAFWCGGMVEEKEKEAVGLVKDFLRGLSDDKKVFVHAYRLPDVDVSKLIEPGTILNRAGRLLDPFQTYFCLSEARIDFSYFEYASSVEIYYFDKEVDWQDFLATADIRDRLQWIKDGILSASFLSYDQGADYLFQCSRKYETRVMQLLESLSDMGYKLERSDRLPF